MNLRKSFNTTDIFGGLGDIARNARLSIFETTFLIAALLFAAFVALSYLAKVQPLNAQLTSLQNREVNLRAELNRMNSDEKRRIDQASNAEKILESLSKFEKYLKPDERGITQIINEIDALRKTHKIIGGDSSYRVAEGDATTGEMGNPKPSIDEKIINVYPVIGIDTTLIGDYSNLRRFLFDLERSKQFLIINSLAFQGEAEKVRRAVSAPGMTAGMTAGKGPQIQLSGPEAIPVSLKIELDTYFQKSSN